MRSRHSQPTQRTLNEHPANARAPAFTKAIPRNADARRIKASAKDVQGEVTADPTKRLSCGGHAELDVSGSLHTSPKVEVLVSVDERLEIPFEVDDALPTHEAQVVRTRACIGECQDPRLGKAGPIHAD